MLNQLLERVSSSSAARGCRFQDPRGAVRFADGCAALLCIEIVPETGCSYRRTSKPGRAEAFRSNVTVFEHPASRVRIVADFYFTMMPRHLPPFASESDVRALRKTAESRLRAAALWWAEALLAKQEAYQTVETVHPPARPWRLLKRSAPPGLSWLLQQMSTWPRRYMNHQWMDLGSILSLYHQDSGRAVAQAQQECHVERRKVPS